MEGRGVTNYAAEKPSFAFTASTTEFDDALISRDIVSFEQAMIAKGASTEEARRLANVKSGLVGGEVTNGPAAVRERCTGDVDKGNDSALDDDEEDEDFLSKYRAMRLEQMKQDHTVRQRPSYGEVIHITRPDWNREVNDASRRGDWVVINLTSTGAAVSPQHEAICVAVEQSVQVLAQKFPRVKFVSIASTSAIENWPPENLPTLFCYWGGKMRHQLVGAEDFGGPGMNSDRIEWRLAQLGVLVTTLDCEPDPSSFHRVEGSDCCSSHRYSSNVCAGSGFGGLMATMATCRGDDESDYDDVD